MGGREWRTAVAALLLPTLLPNPNAVAADWSVRPEITLRETYTDNPALSPTPERGDFITQITPGIRIDGRGARFRANLSYTPSAIFYARNSEANGVANRLTAFGSLEAVEKFFFVEANGDISQHFINPFAPRPAEITTISPNRVETRTFGVSPYLRGQAGSAFSYELRNRNTWTSTDNNALADVRTTQWSARAASPIRLFGWALEYDDSKIAHESSVIGREQNSRLFRGRLYFQPESTLRLSASAGGEENDYALQEKRSYPIYGAGLAWKPGPRTSAELEWERRFFGASRLARLTHRTRLTAWTLAYSRNASTFQQELLRLPPGDTAALLDAIFAARIPDPVERQAAVEQFMRTFGTPAFLSAPLAFFTPQIFLQERLEASVGILGKRNSVVFTGFRAESTPLSSSVDSVLLDAFTPGNRITQRGFGVNASHRVTPFTTLGASAGRTFARQEEPSTFGSRNDYLAVNLTHALSPKTTTFAGLSSSHFKSNGPTSADANSVFVGLNHRF